MKTEYFYYLRNEDNVPYATICIKRDTDGVICRGISICSDKDSFVKKEGRRRSRNFALKAIGTKQSSEPITRVEFQPVLKVDEYFWNFFNEYEDINNSVYKSAYIPVLTKYETKLLHKTNNVN